MGDGGGGGGDGGGRVVVTCGHVEGVLFPQTKNGGGDGAEGDALGLGRKEQEDDVSDEEASDEDEGGGVPLTDNNNENNVADRASRGAVEADPRKAGMERARNREMVRQAARRLVAFGAPVGEAGGQVRAVEAVQGGRVVESSFAKGEWGVRWRE